MLRAGRVSRGVHLARGAGPTRLRFLPPAFIYLICFSVIVCMSISNRV